MVRDAAVPDRQVRPAPDHQIRFVRGTSGVRIAYAMHGTGPPLIVASCWLSHLQHDWESPVWRHFLEGLGSFSRLIATTSAASGCRTGTSPTSRSTRDAATSRRSSRRSSMRSASSGSRCSACPTARVWPWPTPRVTPERVTRLILYGTVCGEPVTFLGDAKDEEETYRGMIRIGWAREDPRFRRVFTQGYIPGATEEQMRWFDELQRTSTSPENYLAARDARLRDDITDELANITAPTLIMHAVGDQSMTFENATMVAAVIPDARVVPLDSQNHILLVGEPAWTQFVADVRAFMEPDRRAMPAAERDHRLIESLSERELEILRLAADGRPNAEIAATLGLSIRTVERHLSNAYGKLGLTGTAARGAAVAELQRAGLA